MASFSMAVLLRQQFTMKLTMSLLLKNTIDVLFFSEHKLYGFPQSDIIYKGLKSNLKELPFQGSNLVHPLSIKENKIR